MPTVGAHPASPAVVGFPPEIIPKPCACECQGKASPKAVLMATSTLAQLSSQVPALQNSPSHLSLIGTFVRRLIKELESWTGSQWLNYLLVPGSDPAEPRLRQLDRSL